MCNVSLFINLTTFMIIIRNVHISPDISAICGKKLQTHRHRKSTDTALRLIVKFIYFLLSWRCHMNRKGGKLLTVYYY